VKGFLVKRVREEGKKLSNKWTLAAEAFVIIATGVAFSIYSSSTLSSSNSDTNTTSNSPMPYYDAATDPTRTVLPGYDYLVYFDTSTGHIDTVQPFNTTMLASLLLVSNANVSCPLPVNITMCINVDNAATLLFHPGPGNRSIIDATGSIYMQQLLTDLSNLNASNPYLPFHIDTCNKGTLYSKSVAWTSSQIRQCFEEQDRERQHARKL
jgi:hypothetical protein